MARLFPMELEAQRTVIIVIFPRTSIGHTACLVNENCETGTERERLLHDRSMRTSISQLMYIVEQIVTMGYESVILSSRYLAFER
ncbi:hypothetical protein PG997_011498 [Apiospora hydei]|uniref:Uncharacterized protein n=1 Tax=Apiospora hydei TaxID=1337664 RepID=A0ABR1VJA9_9PEZI